MKLTIENPRGTANNCGSTAADAVVAREGGAQAERYTDRSRSATPVALDLGSRAPSISDLSASWKSADTDADPPLALSVDASEGRWAVDGQLLKWWYPVPAPGEDARTYTITISRAGGAIKAAEAASSRTCSLWELLAKCCPLL